MTRMEHMKSSFLVLFVAMVAIPRLALGQIDSTTAHVVDSMVPAPQQVDSAPGQVLEPTPPVVTDSSPHNVMNSMFPGRGDSSQAPTIETGAPRMVQRLSEARVPQPVDRIVAVVGVTPILSSQLDEQLLMARSQGTKMPDDSAGMATARHQILDQLVSEELLIQQAERDTSVRVSEQEVQDQVEKTVENVRRQFSTEADFLTQLGAAGFASEEEWRRWLAEKQRRTILQQRLIESLRQKGKLRPIPPSEQEMHDYWEQDSGNRPKLPPQISYRQIVVTVPPDSGSVARARARAESLVVALRRGASFPELAKSFSADSATRAQGGELGWFRRGVMVKSFEEVAFRLKPGEISDVVPSPFGFHIIQVERVSPAEIQARHILIQPVVSPEQVARTRTAADSLYHALVAGAAFDSIGRHYSDIEESPLNEDVPVAQLAPDYAKALGTITAPGLVPPFEVGAATPRPKFSIVEVTKYRAEGDMSFAEVKDRLRQQMGQQLAIKRYIDGLRRSTYVNIRL